MAASRTFWIAGSNSPIKTAMITITTNSSSSVNPRLMASSRMGIQTEQHLVYGNVTSLLVTFLMTVPSIASVVISSLTLVFAG
jgi:hypothetical protein